MAAELVGGAFLSSFLNVLFDRLSDDKFVNWIQGKKLDQKLLGRLENILNVVEAVLNDAVKRWIKNLQDAVYDADDLLDEVCTKAANQKDPVCTNHMGKNDGRTLNPKSHGYQIASSLMK